MSLGMFTRSLEFNIIDNRHRCRNQRWGEKWLFSYKSEEIDETALLLEPHVFFNRDIMQL